MTDFTSSLYLGFRHPSRSLPPWVNLTTGKPAALGIPALSAAIAESLARLQGCERATLLPSTLHLYFDLFETLRRDGIALYLDRGVYPIARWAAERMAGLGVPVHLLPHFDAAAARKAIAASASGGFRPVIVADGFCPSCGRAAPLESYLDSVVTRRGYLVLDDTQALGIWGDGPAPGHSYGKGGGGSLRRHGVRSPNIILGSSLAKGFGVPVAALGGSAPLIRTFRAPQRDAGPLQPAIARRPARGAPRARAQRAPRRHAAPPPRDVGGPFPRRRGAARATPPAEPVPRSGARLGPRGPRRNPSPSGDAGDRHGCRPRLRRRYRPARLRHPRGSSPGRHRPCANRSLARVANSPRGRVTAPASVWRETLSPWAGRLRGRRRLSIRG